MNPYSMEFKFDPCVASAIGIQNCVIYTQVQNFNDYSGVKPTVKDLADSMPYFTVSQIKHALRGLEASGWLASEQPGASKLQMAKVYTAIRPK